MANPLLPIAGSPEAIDISTPPTSERSRSQRAGETPQSGAVAMIPQRVGKAEVDVEVDADLVEEKLEEEEAEEEEAEKEEEDEENSSDKI